MTLMLKISKEEPYGTKNSFKYVIEYNNSNVIRPLRIKLPQMIGYVRKFESNTAMSFNINDSNLFKKYNMLIMWIQIFKAKKCQKYHASFYQ